MDVRGLLEKARSGSGLNAREAKWIGTALATNNFSDAQVGAFAMSVCLNGLDLDARVALTMGMRDSGDVLTWDLPGPILDKHSTGGVGDPVSLLLAPALAACGAFVPMISGRGLGHTGGTLDKLEAIPGYSSAINTQRLSCIVKKVGCVIAGASSRIAPADKRLYAIRDMTGTVNSIDLITASILSKKLAAGLEGLVLDVKVGSGAFMKNKEDAVELARSLVGVANGAGCPTAALITDMSQPLADSAGNALEVVAVMRILQNLENDSKLQEVTCRLGGALLAASSLNLTKEEGAQKISNVIADGSAMERFSEMIHAMGGPINFESSWQNCMPEAPVQREVHLTKQGYISKIQTLTLGQSVVSLGGGRMKENDRIDPSVGVSNILPIGTKIDPKTPVAMIHARSEIQADFVFERLQQAFVVGDKIPLNIETVIQEVDQ